MLRQTWLVFRRELSALLCLPLYYILTGVFFLLASLVYLQQLVSFSQDATGANVSVTESVIVPTFQMLHFFLLIQVPLLTMRVFSEDRATGMLDLLQTTPARDWALLLGKFAGTYLGLLAYVAMTLSFPIATATLGSVDWPVVWGSALALVLASGAYIAVGLLFSVASESQVAAAVLTYVTLFLLVFGQFMASASTSTALQEAARHFTVVDHITGLLSGNVAPMNVAFFLLVAFVGLFLSARLLEARRWRSA